MAYGILYIELFQEETGKIWDGIWAVLMEITQS